MVSGAAILSGLAFAVRWLARGSIKTLVGTWMLMQRFNLHMLLFFGIFVLPELLGSYAFLSGEGIPWYFSMVGAIGVEAGGSAFTAYNNVHAVLTGATASYSVPILLFGAFSSISTLFWYAYIYIRTTNMITSMTPFAKFVIGGTIFALMVMITMMIDQYMLTGDTLRVSGMSYFLEHPDQSLEPLKGFLGTGQGVENVNPGNSTTGNMTK